METRPDWRPLLRNGNFVAVTAGQVVAQMGDNFRYMALQLYVYGLTGSAAALGVLGTVTAIPTLLLGPIAGVVVDRWDRRRIMIASDLVRAVLVCWLVFVPSVFGVYAVGILAACISLFFYPARNALVPRIVGEKNLLAANSMGMTLGVMTMMIAPALASLVIGQWGTGAAFAVNAVTFVLSAAAVLSIRLAGGTAPAPMAAESGAGRWWKEARDGVEFTARSPVVRGLTILFGVQTLGFGALPVIIVVYVTRVLDLPAASMGYLQSAFAGGMLVGGVAVAAIGGNLASVRSVAVNTALMGVGFIALGYARTLPLALAVCLIMGVLNAGINVVVPTLMQLAVPDELRGRVFSALNVVITGVSVLSMGLAGFAADMLPIEVVLAIPGVFSIIAGVIGLRVLSPDAIGAPLSSQTSIAGGEHPPGL